MSQAGSRELEGLKTPFFVFAEKNQQMCTSELQTDAPPVLSISIATTTGASVALAGSNDQHPIDLPHCVLRSRSNLTRHLHFHVLPDGAPGNRLSQQENIHRVCKERFMGMNQ